MTKNLFLINHALAVNQLSVFDTQTRFEQTLGTLDSIDRFCPGSLKIIFDSSPLPVEQGYINALAARGAIFRSYGDIPTVKMFSERGRRSEAETISFMHCLDWVTKSGFRGGRVYKLSGRYELTKDFVPEMEIFKDFFVFSSALPSWMSPVLQEKSGVSKLYRLRLWHMDYTLLPAFKETLPKILKDCIQFGIDVEHSYYKHLSSMDVMEIPVIGVHGFVAPSGEEISE
jgi:hypothetical protein